MTTVNLWSQAPATTERTDRHAPRSNPLAGVSPAIVVVGVLGWGGLALRLVSTLL